MIICRLTIQDVVDLAGRGLEEELGSSRDLFHDDRRVRSELQSAYD